MGKFRILVPLDIDAGLFQSMTVLNPDVPLWVEPTSEQRRWRLFRKILHTLHPGADILESWRKRLLERLGKVVVRKVKDPIVLQVKSRVVLSYRGGVKKQASLR